MKLEKELTAKEFECLVGYPPVDDDLERCNCQKAGEIGHQHCGWNQIRNLPMFMGSGGVDIS